MRYNSICIFDIETIADEKKKEYIPEPTAPANYKDIVKIEEYKKTAKETIINEMALDYDYSKICALGYSTAFNDPEHTIHLCPDATSEIKAIEDFWEVARYSTLIGFNILAFDLPIILRRSWALKIPPTVHYKKYDDRIIDLMLLLYPNSKQKYKSLKNICKIYGIENSCPGIDGSMVKELSQPLLKQYLASDITLTQSLANKMKGYYF